MSTRKPRNTKSPKKTQVEINRTKPLGSLSISLLHEKSSSVKTINVQLPDSEIYEFYHFPITLDKAEEFRSSQLEGENLAALRDFLSDVLCDKNGSEFASSEDLGKVDIFILRKLSDAILESAVSEGGED